MKIVGNTVGMGLPKPNLMQTDPTRGDYVYGKEEFAQQFGGNSGGNACQCNLVSPDGSRWSIVVDNAGNVSAVKLSGGNTGGDTGGDEGGETPDVPEVTLTRISATYSGGSVTAGTAVNDLTGIVVTAHYSDGTSKTVTGYALSGTIAEGNNTITVSYGGKTTTFSVVGTAVVVPTYTVTSALVNVESSNASAVVNEGASYTATLTADDGYKVDSVVVTMGGENVTASVYADGVVNITAVTGNVIVTASARVIVPYEDITWHDTATSIGLNTSKYQCWAPHNMQAMGEYIYYLQCHSTGHAGAVAPWTLIRFKPTNVYDFEQIEIPEFKGLGALLIEGNTIYLYTRTGVRYKSTDHGETWETERTNLGSATEQVNLYGVYKAGNYYYAGNDGGAGYEGFYWRSEDGLNWDGCTVDGITWSDTEMSFTYFCGKYYGFVRDNSDTPSDYSIVLESDDGVNWEINADSVIKIPSNKSNISIVEFDNAIAFGSVSRSTREAYYSVYKADGTFSSESLGVRGEGFDFHAPNLCFLDGVVAFTYSSKPSGTAYAGDYYLAHNMVLLGTYANVSVAHYEIETITNAAGASATATTLGLDSVLPTGISHNWTGNYWKPDETPATLYASEPDFSIATPSGQQQSHPVGWYMNGSAVNLGYADLTISNMSAVLSQKAKVGEKYFTVNVSLKSLFQMDKLISLAGKNNIAQWAEGTYIEDELMLATHVPAGTTQSNIAKTTHYKIKFVPAE